MPDAASRRSRYNMHNADDTVKNTADLVTEKITMRQDRARRLLSRLFK
ncbi:hypothetical protein OK016_26315 [Vibrio chagasii]|nr:hypothetical protein [Vibrio chagasii]